MDIEELEQLSDEKLEAIASDWNGEDDEFIHEGQVYHSDVAENAKHLLDKRMKYEIGDEVTIEYKAMKIPARVKDTRQIFGRNEYKLELLSDGEQVSSYVQEYQLDPYNG